MTGDDPDATEAPQVVIRSGQDPGIRVRLHNRQFLDEHETAFSIDIDADGLHAHLRDVIVAVWDIEDLPGFLGGLADSFRGWAGTRSWAASHLRLTAAFHSRGHVELRWTLRPRDSRQDSWEATDTTWIEAGQQMSGLAADVRDFLTRPEPVLVQVPPCTCCREHVRFAERLVGRDRDAGLLFPFGEDLEQELGAATVEFHVAELVDLCRDPHRSTYADPATMPKVCVVRLWLT